MIKLKKENLYNLHLCNLFVGQPLVYVHSNNEGAKAVLYSVICIISCTRRGVVSNPRQVERDEARWGR